MTDQNDDFVSFDKALRELNLQSEDLKKLVSEGEIRAFRDGDSMKFKREDLESIRGGEEELVFADGLEDDTGMVTEELSDEDTLLAEDDLLDEPAAPAASTSRARSAAPASSGRSRGRVEEEEASEPAWGAVMTTLAFIVMLWASLAVWNIATETPPAGLLAMFAPE